MEEKSLGLLLQVIPYLGRERILKVFTQEGGLITLMSKKPTHSSLIPFCIAEWVYKKRSGDIYPLIDGSLFDPLLSLRQSYTTLTTAGSIAQDLLRSQLPAKGARELYSLLCSYFGRLSTFENPSILAASFRLKLLLHEGLLALRSSCTMCHEEASVLAQGESLCEAHAPLIALFFSKNEWQTLHQLTFAKRFSLLQRVELSPSLAEKISILLDERLDL